MTMGRQSLERVAPFLKGSTFYGGLPDDALAALVGRGLTKRFAKGQDICRRGEAGNSVMAVLSGRLKVANIRIDGREIVLNFLGPGDLVGEIAAIDGLERTANVVALEDSEVFVIGRDDLLPVLMAHPPAMLEMIVALCEKLRTATSIIEDSAYEMRARVAKGLLRLAEQHGVQSKDRIRIDLKLSQTDLGNYLGLSRANISRQLTQLKDAGVIEIDEAQIVILNHVGLIAEAEAASSSG